MFFLSPLIYNSVKVLLGMLARKRDNVKFLVMT